MGRGTTTIFTAIQPASPSVRTGANEPGLRFTLANREEFGTQ
jgi:hypothetical protein